jgi:PAS domain S-box-containing protein
MGRRFGKRALLIGFLTLLGYYLGAHYGFALAFQPHSISAMWLPNSILLSALLLLPYRDWWIPILAAFVAHFAAELRIGVSLPMASCWFFSNSLEAVLGAFLTRSANARALRFATITELWVFLVYGIVIAGAVSSLIDTWFVLLVQKAPMQFWELCRLRFGSNASAGVVVVPAMVSWLGGKRESLGGPPARPMFEAAGLGVSLIAVSVMVFCFMRIGPTSNIAFCYAPLPFLLWATARFGVRGCSAAMLVVCILASWGVTHGRGPFPTEPSKENALSVQVFTVGGSLTLLSLAISLTERRAAVRVLGEREKQYREVVEAQTEMVCRWKPDTTLTFVNSACGRDFGLRPGQLIGRRFLELVPESVHLRILMGTARMALGRSDTTVLDYSLSRGATGAQWYEWTLYPIKNSSGHMTDIQAIGSNVTNRRRVEEAREKLFHGARIGFIGELNALIVHELNQPLNAILNNTEALKRMITLSQAEPLQLSAIASELVNDATRARNLARGIRALSRKGKISLKATDLNQVAMETSRIIAHEAKTRRVGFQTSLSREKLLVMADPVHLEQVLLILMINGLESMAQKAATNHALLLSTEAIGQEVVVSVSDTGAGFTAEALGRIFDSFFSTKEEGVGLGLTIAHWITQAHGGKITVASNSGNGAIVQVRLPRLRLEDSAGIDPKPALSGII